jgi:hypothetical protein
MPEAQLLIPLISTCIGLLVMVLLFIWRIQARLARIEEMILRGSGPDTSLDLGPSAAETSSGGAFESFLNEDPARRALAKSEQFAAYREWRQRKGLNWSNS